MRRLLALGCWLVLSVCGPVDAPDATRPERRAHPPVAVPTTRLVLPSGHDRDCVDFADRLAAQRALRSGDPDRLDADRDGIACERLPPPRSGTR